MRACGWRLAAVGVVAGAAALGAVACSGSSFTTGPADAASDVHPSGDAAVDVDAGIDDATPGSEVQEAPAGTVLLSEDFENTSPPCGLWNPDNSTLTLFSPGHNSRYACLVCFLSAPYGMISAAPGLTASAGQVLSATAYVMAVAADGGPADAGASRVGMDIQATTDDGGLAGANPPLLALAGSWSPVSFVDALSEDVHAIKTIPLAYNVRPGDCFLIDDIELTRQ